MSKPLSALMLCLFFLLSCKSKPGIKDVTPSFGSATGGDVIVIRGGGFEQGLTVRFGKKKASSVTIESSEEIKVKTPAGSEGKVDVQVTTDDGKTYVRSEAFEYRRDK
jgi:hypothetical protein